MAEINPDAPRKDTEKAYKARKARESYRFKDEKLKEVEIDYQGNIFRIPAIEGVDITNLNEDLKSFLYEANNDLITFTDRDFDLILTSGEDSHEGKNSRHNTGAAVDIRISPNYRGERGGDNDATKDPAFQYFFKGKGKELRDKYNINLLDPYHGSAPHIHMALLNELPSTKKGSKGETQTPNNSQTKMEMGYKGEWYSNSSLPLTTNSFVYVNENKEVEDKDKEKREASLAKQKLQNEEYKRKALQNVIQGMIPVEVPQGYQEDPPVQLISTVGVGQSTLQLPNISGLPDPLSNFK